MQAIKLRAVFIFVLLMISGINTQTTAAQTADAVSHVVQPGDTWAALAWRYGLDAASLQQTYGHMNRQRQPTIGSTLLLPNTGIDRTGEIIRPLASVLKTAVSHNLSPWSIIQGNNLQSPYQPLLYRLIFIPNENQAVREYPIGFAQLELSQIPAKPGEAIALRGIVESAQQVTSSLNQAALDVFQNGRFLIGITGTGAFYGSGEPELTIRTGNNPLWVQPWRFVDHEWNFQQITLTGSAAEIDQASRDAERKRLMVIWQQASTTPQWRTPFANPVDSYLEITSSFGARRSYNGGPYSTYHEGVDYAAYGGTPVLAPAAGTVVIAETLYVRGGAVIIDHGLGIYTGYYHMSNVTATPGQQVEQGQLLGEVGTTGFSTGNHLHWDLLVNGIWVDASAWQAQNMGCWILAGLGESCVTFRDHGHGKATPVLSLPTPDNGRFPHPPSSTPTKAPQTKTISFSVDCFLLDTAVFPSHQHRQQKPRTQHGRFPIR